MTRSPNKLIPADFATLPGLDALDAIGDPERTEEWVTAELAAGRRIMGFGHAVYRTRDPRSDLLRELRRHTVPEDDELFDTFALAAELDKPVWTLSGGTKQKLNAALAFMFRPRILLLDEPTAGLDPVASGVLKARIRSARQAGVTVLLVSHVLSELEDLVDDVIFLLEGRVEFQGSLRRLEEITGESRLEPAVARLMQRKAS